MSSQPSFGCSGVVLTFICINWEGSFEEILQEESDMREVTAGQEEFYLTVAALSCLRSVLPVIWCGQGSFALHGTVVYASFIR